MNSMSTGMSAASPVSDGTHIALVLGNGVAAVYDREGKRLWGKFIEASRLGFGPSATPLLIKDKLIVHFNDLVAFQVSTGKELWRTPLPATHASPVTARMGKEDVIVSPAGAVVRVDDGKVLVKGAFHSSDSSPVVVGDTIYLFGDTAGAYRLSRNDQGEIRVNELWSRPGLNGRNQLPSPVVFDGLLYGVTTGGILAVLDATTGREVYRQRLGGAQVYSSLALAGGLLYAIDTNGRTVVFKPGRKFERLAVNQLEETTSSPLFIKDQLYLRGAKFLYCVTTTANGTKVKDSK